ncbi:serine hydrolase [Parasediminibacterium sp. JCM 36343]|uniref:serine hydrolase n=1 Tax=Parasediminibacterium sp. JCM 36343 TaxID=3374279 RepID=UPI00397D44FB
MKGILTFKIPLFYLVILTCIASYSTYLITTSYYNLEKSLIAASQLEETSPASSCDYQIRRLNGYSFIKPLLYADKNCETVAFNPIKQMVLSVIDRYKLSGVLASASVYVRDFNEGDFMSINEDEKYTPGSLMKVPALITYLRMEEDNPGILDKELVFQHVYPTLKKVSLDTGLIVLGKKYTIRQLLKNMIVKGDENATALLNAHIDIKVFQKTFTDMGLLAPEKIDANYPISATDYSLFMRTLYNATYLTINDSEYATELLSKCSYSEIGGDPVLPTASRVAYKFGEEDTAVEKELHESAIVYVNHYPYLITIMTKGNDLKKLSNVVGQISTIVYKQMAAKG